MSEEFIERIAEMIGQALGQASMCWIPEPKGTFDSTKASQVLNELVRSIVLEIDKEVNKYN